MSIYIFMSRLFNGLFDCVKRKRGYCLFLLLLTIVAIVLGVIGAVNMNGDLTINLSHIAYIRFLRGSGFMSMFFGLFLSVLVFFLLILLCNFKFWLMPFAVVFYLYLVYSQTVVFLSIILIYGILNCIILAVFLLIFSILTWLIFLLVMCELSIHCNSSPYLRTCFSPKQSKLVWYLVMITILIFLFTITLTILKNYVLLLVFE